jgi:hypothetical protein
VYYTTINTLDDDILLGIFNCYRLDSDTPWYYRPIWYNISHVCRRWRHIVHSSAFYLGLQILCTHGSPIVDTLDHLPPIPIFIEYLLRGFMTGLEAAITTQDEIGIYRALQLRDRIRSIKLRLSHPTLGGILMVMNSSFPILEHLCLESESTVTVTLPKSFLAPNLRHLVLSGIGLPNRLRLLPSLVSLVTLKLENIGASAYTRPRLLVARLQSIPRLENLSIIFSAPIPRPSAESELLGKRGTPVTLPSLIELRFRGVSAYLERFVSQIRAPVLKRLHITLFNQIAFALPHLSNLIRRTEGLELPTASLTFWEGQVTIAPEPGRKRRKDGSIILRVACKQLDWQIDCIAQVCITLMPALSGVERLTLDVMGEWQSGEINGVVDGTTWHELLRSFISLKKLCICDELVEELSNALEVDGIGSDPSFLPGLQHLVVDLRPPSLTTLFSSFIRARRVAGLPCSFAFPSPPPSPSPPG